MEWALSKPTEKIMIIEIQVSIIYNNAWLGACLQVPTKGTLINDNGDFYPNIFWNISLIASLALFSPHFNPCYLMLAKTFSMGLVAKNHCGKNYTEHNKEW